MRAPRGHPSIPRACSSHHRLLGVVPLQHVTAFVLSGVDVGAWLPGPVAAESRGCRSHGCRSCGCRVPWLPVSRLPVAWLSGLMAAGARGCLSCGCRSRGLVLPGAVGCTPTGPQFAFAPDERHGSGLSASSPALWSAEAVFRNMQRSDCFQLPASGGSGLCHSERPRGVGECVHSLLDGLLPQGPRSVGR